MGLKLPIPMFTITRRLKLVLTAIPA